MFYLRTERFPVTLNELRSHLTLKVIQCSTYGILISVIVTKMNRLLKVTARVLTKC